MSRVHQVRSFEGFVEDLQQQRPELVVVQAERKPLKGLFGLFGVNKSAAVGMLGNWQHGLHYEVSKARRSRNHFEPLLTAFESEYGFGDKGKRQRRGIATLLAAETRVDLLQSELPNTTVYMTYEDGQPISDEVLQVVHDYAQEHGVVSALEAPPPA